MDHWIGCPASLAVRKPDGSPAAAAIACPDGLGVAWLHLFAAEAFPGPAEAWGLLWPAAGKKLATLGVSGVWAMAAQPWMIRLLEKDGFTGAGRVIAFVRTLPRMLPDNGLDGNIRPMEDSDLPQVEQLDHAAFSDPWRMDREALRVTYHRSVQAVVHRRADRISGYLLASLTPHGVHITRLAVQPAEQGRGIGRALVARLLNDLLRRDAPRVSVNTQIDNLRSQRLYRSLGFVETGDTHPVFQCVLSGSATVPAEGRMGIRRV